ncbi:hypothetical protein PPIS_a6005 [Pseudoalteromonas piscicida]|uniref:Uncharacterized protein n=1 Tax=Pseudoalteromonas piscicida TaxID=43662 RepID=A0ABN5CGT3_PSEO7|nr:hypothetical protein PPIS_a6005 [Pseudoalteromonas piscicida]
MGFLWQQREQYQFGLRQLTISNVVKNQSIT